MVYPATQVPGEFTIDALRQGGPGGLLAKAFSPDYTLGGTSRANARLIAAAPELLEACEAVVNHLAIEGSAIQVLIQAAIAKARP